MANKALTDPVDVTARTLYGEARGCGAAGMSHIANVICNRVHDPQWWGDSFVEVCLKPYQFSCWNPDDPNLPKLLAVENDREFAVAMQIAAKAVAGQLPDETFGADSYYALSMQTPPVWAAKATRTFADGWHAFYRTVAADDVRNVSVHHVVTADELNAEELEKDNP